MTTEIEEIRKAHEEIESYNIKTRCVPNESHTHRGVLLAFIDSQQEDIESERASKLIAQDALKTVVDLLDSRKCTEREITAAFDERFDKLVRLHPLSVWIACARFLGAVKE